MLKNLLLLDAGLALWALSMNPWAWYAFGVCTALLIVSLAVDVLRAA